MTFRVIPADKALLPVLAESLREADRIELAAQGCEPLPALVESFEYSDEDMRWIAMVEDRPVAAWGASRVRAGTGSPWLLGSDEMVRYRKDFWLASVFYTEAMQSRYPVLYNYIDDRNVVTRRWLTRLGFEMTPVREYFRGYPFTLFMRTA